jgi:hypothetical protein
MQDASWLTIGESVDIFEVGSGTGTDIMDPVKTWLAIESISNFEAKLNSVYELLPFCLISKRLLVETSKSSRVPVNPVS